MVPVVVVYNIFITPPSDPVKQAEAFLPSYGVVTLVTLFLPTRLPVIILHSGPTRAPAELKM
jgi:hypothetical protein